MKLQIAPSGHGRSSSTQDRLDDLCRRYEQAKAAEDHALASSLASHIGAVLDKVDDDRALHWWTAARAHARIGRLCATCREPAIVHCSRCGDYACTAHLGDDKSCPSCGRSWLQEASA